MQVKVSDIHAKGTGLVYVTEKRLIEINEEYGLITISPVEKTNDEQYAKLIMMLFIEEREPGLDEIMDDPDMVKYVARSEDMAMEFWVTIRKLPDGTTVEIMPAPASSKPKKL